MELCPLLHFVLWCHLQACGCLLLWTYGGCSVSHVHYLSIYLGRFPQFWGVADNTKKTTKTMGVTLRSSSNDEGPGWVWMALLEQHTLSSPVFHILRRFIDAISPTAPTTGVASIRQPRGNSRCRSKLHHNRSPLILLQARSLASLTSILLSFRALFTPSFHPNLGLPLALLPSTFAFVTFFSSRSLCILSTWPNHVERNTLAYKSHSHIVELLVGSKWVWNYVSSSSIPSFLQFQM